MHQVGLPVTNTNIDFCSEKPIFTLGIQTIPIVGFSIYILVSCITGSTHHRHTHTHTHYIHTWFVSSRYVKRFEWPLLVQSVIMIVAMLMLLHLCVHVDHEKEKTITVTHRRFLGEEYEL